jgi:hypothetical protein
MFRTSDPASRGAGAFAERVEICTANGLPGPTAPIGIEKGRVADVGAPTGLGVDDWRKQEQRDSRCEETDGDHEALRIECYVVDTSPTIVRITLVFNGGISGIRF